MNNRGKRKHVFIFSTLLLVVSSQILSADKAAQLKGAESVPQRIILSLSADPAHAMPVTWQTDTLENLAQAQIAEANPHPDFEQWAKTIAGTAAQEKVGTGRIVGTYRVEFTGLKPDRRYLYRVGNGATWSEWNAFRTASDKPDAFRFIYVGDAQNDIKSMWSRAIRAAYSFAPDARFIIHAGDLVEQGYDDNLWGEWCDAMGFISSMTPNFPVPGNHDLHRAPDDPDPKNVLSVSPVWRRMFSLPTNGPEGVEELNQQSYYIDYQGVRFVAIDVNVYSNDAFLESQKKRLWEKQTAWLEQILKNNPNRWTIVIQHQPIYPVSKGRDYEEMRAVLAPLYDRYHVDLVLQGHDHAYARSNKIFNGRIVPDSQDGTIYVISVSGPKMYEPSGKFDALMAKQIRHTQLFQVVQVNGSELTFQAYTSESQLVDSFNLKKK